MCLESHSRETALMEEVGCSSVNLKETEPVNPKPGLDAVLLPGKPKGMRMLPNAELQQ